MKEHKQSRGKKQQHEGGDAEDFFGAVLIFFSQLDGGERGAARAQKRGKGGDQRDHGECQPYARERIGSDALNLTDVHAIHHVIEHVDRLGDDGRKRQTHHGASNRRASQIKRARFMLHAGIPL